jgi:hypothetical protein
VTYTPFTTLAGMIEKHTGEEPFAVPQIILDAAKGVQAEKIPLDFLANADTTSGSSGSPVVNGRGELVGLNFDLAAKGCTARRFAARGVGHPVASTAKPLGASSGVLRR